MPNNPKGYLLDTSVISAFAPGRPPLSAEIAEFFHENADKLFISAVTVQEIQKGAMKLRLDSRDKSKKATALSHWLDSLIEQFSDRILPIDSAVARLAGVIEATATAKGRNPGFADVLIASTAKANDLVLLTANMKHFEPLDIDVANPFE
ncbi:type II toxin-antitoxin system VapC family toxin [Brucella gallinifaecis]|uniref:type II toxin-antitoxin system VapC family toxin n=1 Tax=Brucella gallinifaecis TaxID=215590 RepID=UPI00235EFB46|nr:type II toxin-antitoxin system VapC family toxin [Brucella gallinifaecis]